ncbi:MAG: hypothetical protein Q7J68_03460, partial [Thermoplasmata archaeon]|nr:hypothetical protein [Thermoplasmata archaeon]
MRKAIVVLIVVMLVVVATVGIFLLQGPDVPERELAESYEVEITSYFNGDEGIRTDGPQMQGMAYRMSTYSCDRFYAAGGDGAASPLGLYAYELDGQNIWNFDSSSRISTSVLVNNFGSFGDLNKNDVRIFFGCENGQLFVLKDGFVEASSAFAPVYNNAWSYNLNSEVVGIDYYDQRDANQSLNYGDMFFASTTNGTLYAFRGGITEINPITGQANITQPTLAWTNHISNDPLTSPTISDDGKYVFVGSRDGLIHGIDAASGLEIPEWDGPYRVSDKYWSTSPVAVSTPARIYASTSDGLIHCIWGSNGTAVSGWTHLEDKLAVNGYQLKKPKEKIDGGCLTDISMSPDGSTIIVGSDTGYAYSMSTQDISQTLVFDTRVRTQETQVNVMPFYDWRFSKYLYVVARHLNNTATDPSDDFSILYCLASANNSTLIWKVVRDGVIL